MVRQAPAATFKRVREFLANSGYTEQFLLHRLEVPALHNLLFSYGVARDQLDRRYQGPGLPLFLARLLMGGYPATPGELDHHLGPLRADFEQLGLIENGRSPVVLYPALDFFVAADRPMYSDETRAYTGSDYVLSGTEGICRAFLKGIGQTPCDTFLDLGCGSGLAALIATDFARKVTAIDIIPRAAAYARFNAALNGRVIEVLEGDLFEPVKGRAFDRIASNPPFEPPLKHGYVFSVGGADGEAILERLIAQSPRHLTRGGRLYCQISGTDRAGESFDERIGRWLGPHASECDTLVLVRQKITPREYAVEQVMADNSDSWKLDEWMQFYARLKATQVLIGHLILQRREQPRPVFHERYDLAPGASLEHMEYLAGFLTRTVQPGFADAVLNARPKSTTTWRAIVEHGPKDGSIAELGTRLRNTFPFQVEIECGAGFVAMLAHCDGTRTGAGLLEWLTGHGAVTPEQGKQRMAEGLAVLAAGGFLEPLTP